MGHVVRITLLGAGIWLLAARPVKADDPITPAHQQAGSQPADTVGRAAGPGVIGKLTVTVGKSLTIDSPLAIKRLSTANGNLVEAVAIGPKEVLINGKQAGETSLIIWQENDTRLIYDLTVRISPTRLNAVREQIARDYPDADINVTFDNDTAFVRGTVKDVLESDRIIQIVSTLGKAVNLLRVEVPPVEAQILLKVRFADVDRKASLDLSAGLATGNFNFSLLGPAGALITTLTSGGSIFTSGSNFNMTSAIQALQGSNKLQMLAEPNLLAINGKPASFNVGGEFPYPMIQPGSSGSAPSVTIAFKQYGILLNYTATITPRGTIRIHLVPEVSSLDYTNASTFQGYVIPGTSVRRAETEVELDSGQSFIIAGLLDKETTESLSKVPGISSIPIIGNLFKQKTLSRNNNELMIIITPELVRPLAAQQALPELNYTRPFLPNNSNIPMRQPGLDVTGPVPVHPPNPTMPVEQLQQMQRTAPPAPSTANPTAPPANPTAPPAGPGGQAPPANPGAGGANPGGGGNG